jgi:hypothetical protein
LSSPSRQEIVNKSTKGSCRHQVDRKGIVVTKSTSGRHTVDQRGCRLQVDRRSSHSRPMGLSSPSRQEVVTQSTEGRCRHQVSKKGMSSPSRQEVVTQSTAGGGTPSQPQAVGDTKSTQGAGTPSQPTERGHQVNPRKKGRGHQVNPRSGDTKSTHGEREGTPSQPTEKGRGHQVNPRKSRRAYQLIN